MQSEQPVPEPQQLGTGPGGGPGPEGSDAKLDQDLMVAGLLRAVHDEASPDAIRFSLEMVRDSGLDPRQEYEAALRTWPGQNLPTFEEVDPDSPDQESSGPGPSANGATPGTATPSGLEPEPGATSTSPPSSGVLASAPGLGPEDQADLPPAPEDLAGPSAPGSPDEALPPEGPAPSPAGEAPPRPPNPREAIRRATMQGNRGRRPPAR